MTALYLTAAMILLTTVTTGLYYLLRSPRRVVWLLTLQLLGTALVAIVLLLAHAVGRPGLYDLALVLGILAAILAVAFVQSGLVTNSEGDDQK